jgi:hypothetical protein
LNRVIELAAAAGRDADIPALTEKRTYLENRIVEEYFDPATGDFFGNDQGANCNGDKVFDGLFAQQGQHLGLSLKISVIL